MAYEFDGEKYEKASTHQKEWGTRLITELHLQGDEHVLDLGCGDGALTAQIANLAPDGLVIGIDSSDSMIGVAHKKQTKHLLFMLMDINEISFDQKFDVIFSNATLHWVKDHQQLLHNVWQALRPGGRLRFNFAADGNCSNFFKVVRQAMLLDEFSQYFADFQWPWYMPGVDEYAALAKTSDLKDVQVWAENADRYFPDEEAMMRWIDQPSIVPFMPYLPAHYQSRFRAHVVEEMINQTKQDDGRCFETFRRINMVAKKLWGSI